MENKQQWNFLKKAAMGNRLPQAFLFAGEEGLGQKDIALEFAKLIFCENKTGDFEACKSCLPCSLMEKIKHPDLVFVAPQTQEILIDQIRDELQTPLSFSPAMAKMKVSIINQAHRLNAEAQNCFLKTLEEPVGPTLFILITPFPHILLSTVQSRCEIIKFYPQKSQEEKRLLEEFSNKEPENFLRKDLVGKFIFLKNFFEKNKESEKESGITKTELSAFLENMVWVLRRALWQRVGGEIKPVALFKTKNAIELVQEAKNLLQTTNVKPRLLMENLALQLN